MNPTFLKALALVCIFGAVAIIIEVLVRSLVKGRVEGKAINVRLKMIGKGRSHGDTMNLLRRAESALPEGLPSFVAAIGRKFERMLMQAQLTIPTGQLMLLILLAPAAVFFLILIVMFGVGLSVSAGRVLMVATFAAAIGGGLPLMAINFKATRTRKKMQEQFPVALDVFVRGLRAGHPIAAALDLLTVEMPDPVGSQFGIAVDEVTYGAELRDALSNMADRWDLEDIRMFVVSLSVQSETGGNLAEILENLSKVIRERQSMYLKVRALSSEGRMTGVMLTVLPVFTFVMLFILSPGFFLDVANDPIFVPGFIALVVMYLTGFFMIRKMVDLKV